MKAKIRRLLDEREVHYRKNQHVRDKRYVEMSEAEGDALLARVAPNWREHLADGHVVDHIFDVLGKFGKRSLTCP